MSATWYGDAPPPDRAPLTPLGRVRFAAKTIVLGCLVFGGLLILLAGRLIEAPLCGPKRPVTPYITVFVCRLALRVIGLRLTTEGPIDKAADAIVSNHASWLDIFVLNAVQPLYFVSKSEVAEWPGIGWLARATGTLFISRDRSHAAQQTEVFRNRMKAGHQLLFFPEGTSSDGLRVLPFKTTLFAAFFPAGTGGAEHLQPVTVCYTAPKETDPRFYGWWGDMDFGSHLVTVLASAQQGAVHLTFHPTLRITDFEDRKSLAAAAEDAVRRPEGHTV